MNINFKQIKIFFILLPMLFLSACSIDSNLNLEDFKYIDQAVSLVNNNISKIDFSQLFSSSSEEFLDDYYLVEKVVDGDTIKVKIDGELKTIRLIGLDTPEVVDPRKIVECFGREASDKAKEILNGQKIRLEIDNSQGDQDKYGRLLCYVYLEDNTFFNKWMIENGYGHEYTYDVPYNYQTEFQKAENYARENKVGLWADDACLEFENSTNSASVSESISTPTPSPELEELVDTMESSWKEIKDIFDNLF
ncbi:MAG TPA: thermonuclease family protein [bacterium]|nr:thermonuclease family protein [bacterium]